MSAYPGACGNCPPCLNGVSSECHERKAKVEIKLPCGCMATWANGYGVVSGGYNITASAFLCPDKHAQGDFVS